MAGARMAPLIGSHRIAYSHILQHIRTLYIPHVSVSIAYRIVHATYCEVHAMNCISHSPPSALGVDIEAHPASEHVGRTIIGGAPLRDWGVAVVQFYM